MLKYGLINPYFIEKVEKVRFNTSDTAPPEKLLAADPMQRLS